ncbi:MAG TPA: Hsp70 family protein, partial [Longimicrobium sp.]|nr:Hsp70 family protein [Longimicrobium sp.]
PAMTHRFREVIGLDLGHGETAVAWAALEGSADPAILEVNLRRTQVTAVGRHPDFGIVVGERVLTVPGVRDIRIGFKARPPGDPGYPVTLRDFVSEYHRLILQGGQVSGEDEICYFVGCPSGWSADEVRDYERMLHEAGLPHVRVVRESRAALLQAKESGRVTPAQLVSSVLVIDVGSSTVDVSHVHGGLQDEKLDAGMDLGAALIDRLIFSHTVAHSPRPQALATVLDDPAHHDVRTRCEFACRKAKESFFADEEAYTRFGHAAPATTVTCGEHAFTPQVTARRMDEILALPLAELGGRSWTGAFAELLCQADDALRSRGLSPAAVVLTGGAARMSFVERMCRERFPAAALVRHPEPEEAVARGLARWGQIFLNTNAFSQEVMRLGEERVPPLVRDRKASLVAAVAEEVSGGIAEHVVGPALLRWREEEIATLNGLNDEVAAQAEAWLRSSAGQQAVARACETFLKQLAVEVDGWTLELCRRYRIPPTSLRLDPGEMVRGELPRVPVNTRVDNILGATGIAGFLSMIILGGILKPAQFGMAVPGWAMVAAPVVLILMLSLPVAEARLYRSTFPRFLRERLMPLSQLEKVVQKTRARLRDEIGKVLAGNEFEALVTSISGQITAQLNGRADEVKWIIS